MNKTLNLGSQRKKEIAREERERERKREREKHTLRRTVQKLSSIAKDFSAICSANGLLQTILQESGIRELSGYLT